MVIISQRQERPFAVPLTIDIYQGELTSGKVPPVTAKTSYPVWLRHSTDTFFFSYPTRPDLINVDAGKYILWQKTDHKTLANFSFQYTNAGNFVDRREAIAAALHQPREVLSLELIGRR